MPGWRGAYEFACIVRRTIGAVSSYSFGWLSFFGLICCLSAAPVGVSEDDLTDDYVIQNWTVDEGLPQNSVTRIAQTSDGYLWMSTYNGLARFDGVRFSLFNSGNTPAIVGNVVESLHRDFRGRLCILMDGGNLTWVDHGVFSKGRGLNGLPDTPLGFRGESPDGSILFFDLNFTRQFRRTDSGNFVESPIQFRRTASGGIVESSNSTNAAPQLSDEFAADAHGELWRRKSGRWEWVWMQSVVPILPATAGVPAEVQMVCPAPDGGVWFASDRGVHLLRDHRWLRNDPAPEPIKALTGMTADAAGNLWIGTWSQSLFRVDRDGKYHRYNITHGKEPEAVRSVFKDQEGNLWFGTEGSGVFRLRPRVFHTYGAAEGMRGEVVKSVTEDDSGRILAVDQAGLERIEPVAKPRIQLYHPHEVGWSVYRDSGGRIWMGDYAGRIIYWARGEAVWFPTGGATALRPITVLFEQPGEGLWVGTENGLWRIAGDRYVREPLPTDSMGSAVRAMAMDHRSQLWLGLEDGGLLYKKAGVWTRAPELASLPLSRVSALAIDRDDTLWIGTAGSGLMRLADGKLTRFDASHEALPGYVGSITEDESGYLWLGSLDGIYRVKRHDLDRIADGQNADLAPVRYTRADGLGTSECATAVQPCVCRARDGRLWFATSKGISVVNPSELAPDPQPPPVLIEESVLWGDTKRIVPFASNAIDGDSKSGPQLRVPPDNRLMEIHYTAPSFGAPERVRFRYRINGMDARWVDAGSRRVAYYQGLPPGNYRFQVTACNKDGVWNETGAALSFLVAPHYWQTAWFRVLCGAGIFALGVLAYRIRMAQIEAVNKVRFRLAGDLHDEIGANLGSIGLNAELLQQDSSLSPKQREELSGLHRLAAQTTQSVRDLVWFINPEFDNTTGMLLRMKDVAGVQLAGREWHFDAANLVADRALSPEFRRNVFFIFKEALHNIAKHSGASKVEVLLRDAGTGLEMIVQDNGRGLPSFDGTAGHGMKSMRRRAAELGGSLEVGGGQGQGTRVVLRAPFESNRSRRN
jgi:ligand-binding sensor domain-containing protein